MSQNLLHTQRLRDANAYYVGTLLNHPKLMVGRLSLNARYLAFHICDVRQLGLLGPARLSATASILAIGVERILDVSIEEGIRSRRSRPNWKNRDDFNKKALGQRGINLPPGPLDSSERFSQLMVTAETDSGVEVAVFEVENAHAWEQALRAHVARNSR